MNSEATNIESPSAVDELLRKQSTPNHPYPLTETFPFSARLGLLVQTAPEFKGWQGKRTPSGLKPGLRINLRHQFLGLSGGAEACNSECFVHSMKKKKVVFLSRCLQEPHQYLLCLLIFDVDNFSIPKTGILHLQFAPLFFFLNHKNWHIHISTAEWKLNMWAQGSFVSWTSVSDSQCRRMKKGRKASQIVKNTTLCVFMLVLCEIQHPVWQSVSIYFLYHHSALHLHTQEQEAETYFGKWKKKTH